MATQIFINLPVKDLNRSVEFFTKLGYTFNPQFTNEDATMMIIDENIYVMLLVEKFFQTFTKKEIANTATTTEVILCLSADSREQVDVSRIWMAICGRLGTWISALSVTTNQLPKQPVNNPLSTGWQRVVNPLPTRP